MLNVRRGMRSILYPNASASYYLNQNLMNFEQYIHYSELIESSLILFLQNQNDTEEHYQNLIQIFEDHKIAENPDYLKEVLLMIISFSNDFHRFLNFFDKIEKIILFFRQRILEFWSNIEIFHIFKSNKRILLFLFNKNILILDQQILNIFCDAKFIEQKYLPYFYPEINTMIKSNLDIEDEIIECIDYQKKFFLEKRQIGENDTLLCEFIRKDNIEEFIDFINKEDIPLSSKIMTSIFETNSFLLNNCPTLLEYSAFFGSIRIFRYLIKNGAKFTSTLLSYSIHGENTEIIEEIGNHVNNSFDSYINSLIESIKCHNNILTQFVFDSYLKNSIKNIDLFNEVFNKHCLKYYNFLSSKKEVLMNSIGYYMNYINKNHQKQINENKSIDEKTILYNLIRTLSNKLRTLQDKVNDQNELITSITEENNCLKQENRNLHNMNKSLRLQNSILKKKIKKAINLNNLLIGKLKKTNSKLNELNNQLQYLAKHDFTSSDEVEYGPENINTSIILELFKNSKINVYCRRYSKILKDICFLIYINSNLTYRLLRKFIPLPHPDNLRKEYRDTIKNKEDNLLNKSQIKYLLEELRKEMTKDENEPIVACIAFDAATIDPRN